MKSIKKVLAICAVAVCATLGMGSHASAQNVLEKGTNIAGIGAGLNFRTIGGENYSSATINIFGERCLADNLWDDKSAFTLGGQGLVNVFKYGSSYFVGPRAGLHYHFVPKLDTYVFVALGLYGYRYNFGESSVVDMKDSSLGFGYNSGIGVRYMFTPTIGGFAELGYGVSVLNIGATFKL